MHAAGNVLKLSFALSHLMTFTRYLMLPEVLVVVGRLGSFNVNGKKETL